MLALLSVLLMAQTDIAGQQPAAANQAERTALRYHYFKNEVALELNIERIAIRGEDAPLRTAIGAAGMDVGTLSKMPIPGWLVVDTNPADRTPSQMEALSRALAADLRIEFVSPVFRDSAGGPLIVTPDILIGFNENIADAAARAVLAQENAGLVRDRGWTFTPSIYCVRPATKNGFDVLALANRLAVRDDVRFAEPDMIFTGSTDWIPNDTSFGTLWGIHNTGQSGGTADMDMDGPEAWDILTGDPAVVIVVIDNGVQQDHPDIQQIAGRDFTGAAGGNGGPMNACDNHGTAVAGCVTATINNNLGVVGIAPSCRTASARCFVTNVPCDGNWTTTGSWTVDALNWADQINARVTNNSNAYTFTLAAIDTAYANTRNTGMVHFAASGNSNVGTVSYPANIAVVNAVGAINNTGARALFAGGGGSNWGAGLDFAAPGLGILTTDQTGANGYGSTDYTTQNGTSFASPYAAGVAALVWSETPGLNANQVETIMQASSVDLGTGGYDTTFGWGLVNAHKAVQAASPGFTWVDFNYNGPQNGSFFLPWNTLSAALSAAPTFGTIMLKQGVSPERWTSSSFRNTEVTIRAWNGTAVVGQ